MNKKEQRYSALKQGERGILISIIAYLFLTVIKLVTAYFTDSTALKADGLNNSTDVIASIALFVGLRLSQKPADADHPYGHWKNETIASLIASLIMFVVGIQVLFDAFEKLIFSPRNAPTDAASIYVALFGALVMFCVYAYNMRLYKKINNQAVFTAAKDNLSDAYVSVGTAIGIAGTFLHLYWLDAFTAIIVSLLICKTAWSIFYQTTHRLSDGYDENEIILYKNAIKAIPGIIDVKELCARWYGNNIIVETTIFVDKTLNIQKAHDIATQAEEKLMQQFDIYKVIIHIEPNNLIHSAH